MSKKQKDPGKRRDRNVPRTAAMNATEAQSILDAIAKLRNQIVTGQGPLLAPLPARPPKDQ